MSKSGSPLSPLNTSTPGSRHLSQCRRGSMAAPDPFGKFPDTERGMSSTLTITRAPPSLHAGQDADDRARRRRSTGSHARTPSGGSNSGRISFAFSAFSPISPQKETGSGPRNASADPQRPASPKAVPRSNSFTALQSHLTPMQVYEVAQQCNYPQSQPSTPGGVPSASTAPVSFTPLPDAVHLPFLDRASEVQALVSTPPTSKMFSLLAQTFPSSADDDTDPKCWTYAQLERWLTKVDRDEADDIEWVTKARTCISARSELIWERVKGALGVPPELDTPYEPTEPLDISEPEISRGPGTPTEEVEDHEETFGAWVEPIVASPAGTSPRPHSHSPTDFRRSPSLGRQSISRMQDISEDAPSLDLPPPSLPPVHGLRVVTSPSSPPGRRESNPLPTSAGSFSHPHVPYDAAAERGPGHPLFPSSFASLALGPTLSANNPALRRPSAPPASAYPLAHSMPRHRRRVPSWAEGWDPQNQEYAVSIASGSSRRSAAVEV